MRRQSRAGHVRALAALTEQAAAEALSEKRRAAANARWEKERLRRAAAAATTLPEEQPATQAAPSPSQSPRRAEQLSAPAVTVAPAHLASDPLSTAVAIAKDATPEAIGLLLGIMRGDRFPANARLKAIEMVCEIAGLDDQSNYAERDVLEMDATQLDAFIAAASAAITRLDGAIPELDVDNPIPKAGC